MRALIVALLSLVSGVQRAPLVPVAAMAPDFTVTDDRGVARSLANYRGKFVVLEWHEKGCPYVTKHYRTGHMQALQKKWMDQGVTWLLINSSAEGFHSYLTPQDSRAYAATLKAQAPMLLDTTGKVGKLYGVTTALHMVIVDPTGKVVYNGAIDDQPKQEAASLVGATNYVDLALTALFAKQPVSPPTTTPYGCEVHYRQ